MRPELEFRGTFASIPDRALLPGNWYMGFACRACGKSFAVLDDPSGRGETVPSGTATFEVECPSCGTPGSYPVSEMKVFQSAVGGVTSPA